jgi:plastocyanin
MKRLARSALALVAITLAPTLALAANVKGKVTNTRDLLNSVWNEAKDPAKRRFTFREPAASVPADARVLRGHLAKELCIAATSEAGGAKPAGAMRIVVEGGRTSVVTIVVAPGQELLFENHDPTPHTLYEVNGKGDFSKSTLAPNAQRTWTPTAPGTYELRDELAPSLRSWIVVEPKLVKAVVAALESTVLMSVHKKGLGEFTMPGLFKVSVVNVPAKKKRTGIDPFTKQERVFAAKPASVKIKVRALKKLKDAAL